MVCVCAHVGRPKEFQARAAGCSSRPCSRVLFANAKNDNARGCVGNRLANRGCLL